MKPVIYLSEKNDGPMGKSKNISPFLKSKNIDPEKLIRADLTHGKNVVTVRRDLTKKRIKKTDGLITRRNIFLGVTVCDCLPIYLYSERMIGILHAGWRGIWKGILEESIDKIKKMGESPEDVNVFIGPAIDVCHFEIKSDLVKKFKNYKNCIEKREGKTFLNLKKVAKSKLINRGVSKIKTSSRCTFCDENLFSYRRCGEVKKMLAIIGINN